MSDPEKVPTSRDQGGADPSFAAIAPDKPETREEDSVALPKAWGNGFLRRLRIASYASARTGLGHVRRSLLVAQTLGCSSSQPVILMISGTREAASFAMPPDMDYLTLPALRKDVDGRSHPRYLDIPLQKLLGLRAKTIAAALEAFEPDVLIVDKEPYGVLRELEPSLESLRRHGRTRCVLGLRDVLDDPETVRTEWGSGAYHEAIRDYYDAVWIYGDPAVYDPVREYNFPSSVAAKVRYTGYLGKLFWLPFVGPDSSEARLDPAVPSGPLVLCLVGGGQDGARLAEAFADADLPAETTGVILTGPFMPQEARQRLKRQAARHPRLRVLEFVVDPDLLLSRADRVIAMGGYNTICEVLSFEKRGLIVPRVRPRREQLIRAERLRDLGLLDMLHPDDLQPRALSAWLARDLEPPISARDRIDLNGAARLPSLLEEVLAAPSSRTLSSPERRRMQHAGY